jgi:hypothetical protein
MHRVMSAVVCGFRDGARIFDYEGLVGMLIRVARMQERTQA